MSEQSKRLAVQFELSKDKRHIIDASGLQRERVLDEAFVSMQVELKEHLEKQCEELNHEPQIKNILVPNLSDEPIGITRKDSGSFLSIKFDANLHKVTFRCEDPGRFKSIVE